MLYAPLVIAAAVVQPKRWDALALTVIASTGVFLAQQALAQILRSASRSRTGAGPVHAVCTHPAAPWLALYLAVAAAGGLSLIFGWGRWELLVPAGAALALWGVHSLLRVWPPRRRWDRTVWGEALGVTALGLTAPAAWVAATGSLAPEGWLVWAASVLYFSSAIFHVRMLLEAAKVKQQLTWKLRLKIARHNLVYHGLLSGIVAAGALAVGGRPGFLGAMAFVPGILRALYATVRLDTKLPPLKRLGVLETLYSCWFAVFLILALASRA